MDPMTLGLIVSAAPSVIDLLTGASANEQKAQNNQQTALMQMLSRMSNDIGTGASDSASFKASQSLNNKNYDRGALTAERQAAARGSSGEQRLGAMSMLNDSYNTSQMNAIQIADQERRRLQAQRDQLQQSLGQMQVQRAGQAVNNQQRLTSGFSAMAPYLMDSPKMNAGSTSAGSGLSSTFSNYGVRPEDTQQSNTFAKLFGGNNG